MPSASVIIPCYNHGYFLPYALNSIQAQTFADWEAIIVDDGSTDNTRDVAAQFADPRISYLYQENRGLSAARNKGIRAARGKYLAFLDADDEWETNFLTCCITILDQHPSIGFVYTRTYFIDMQGKRLPQLGGQTVPGEQFRERILEGGFFPPHATLLPRHVLEKVGEFDINLTSVEDWDLWLRISQRYLPQGIDVPLARYRTYPGSMSTNASRMHANRMTVLTKHFGPPNGDSGSWSVEKRWAYAFAYRSAAFGYTAQHESDKGWQFLLKAVETEPTLLQRLDTFYELALGDQPRGYRGEARLLDIESNGVEMLHRLDALFASAGAPVLALKGAAFGNAFLALCMLNDQAGQWSTARLNLVRAIESDPSLLKNRFVLLRLAKLIAGQNLVNFASLAMRRRSDRGIFPSLASKD